MRVKLRLVALLIAFSLGACAIARLPALPDDRLIEANWRAADQIAAAPLASSYPQAPLIVATIVNIDSLEHSSTLGRLISEQVGTRLAQAGWHVIELKLRGDLFVKRGEGELLLSREARDIAQSHQARAVLVGTYARGDRQVYVNLKLVDPNTNRVMAGTDYAIELDRRTAAMLP